MFNRIVEELKRKGIALNHQQIQAAMHGEGPCIVLAVPGSGKTTTMVVRIYILIKYYGVNPKNILSMTFSREAARDMKERFSLYFDNTSIGELTFSTIHAFSYSVVKNYEKEIGMKYKLIEGNGNKAGESENSLERKASILKGIYKSINGEYLNEDLLEILCNEIGLVKNKMLKFTDFSNHNFKINNFLEIFNSYEEYKKKKLFIDYDDMLSMAYDILMREPQLLTAYRSKYRYILIDEAQDSSLIQHKIIQLLAYPNNNIYIVADDDQSIYGFRAAEPKELLNFKNTYPKAKLYFMEQNYRSTNNIVKLADNFIKCNRNRYTKKLFTQREEGNKIQIIKEKSEIEQTNFLLENFFSKKEEFIKTAVLYRNNISSVILVDELERNKIPFYMKDSRLYIFNHWVTLDIFAYLKLSQNNNDMDAFERIYYKIGLYFKRPVLDYVRNYNKRSIFETLMKCPLVTDKQQEIIYGYKKKSDILCGKKPDKAIEFIYNDLKYKDYLRKDIRSQSYSSEGLNKIVYVLKVLAQKINTFSEFFERITRLSNLYNEAAFNKDRSVLTLSTIHSAKGLEYDTVYIIDVADGEFPSYDSLIASEINRDNTLLEEENRLFYVGITRAKDNLIIFHLDNKYGVSITEPRYVTMVRDIISRETNINKFEQSIGYNLS